MARRVRTIPVIITSAFMAFMMTSCSFVKIINNGQPLNSSLSEDELARLVTQSVQKSDKVASSFSSIPSWQLDSVSYSTFAEYTNILREITKGRGDITSFRFLNEEEKGALDEEISDACRINMNDIYPNEDLVEIICDDDSDQKVYFPLKKGDTVTLDGKAMADTIASYNYVLHYMSMVYDSNSSALVSILAPMYTDEIYIDSVIRSKAEHIIDYYSKYAMSGYDDITISLATPCLVRLSLPKIRNANGEIFAKEINIINRYGSFYIEDKMPVNPQNKRVFLYNDGQKSFAVGDVLTRDKVVDKLGKPLYELSREDTKTGLSRVVMSYKGMNLAFDATFNDAGEWTGTLASIRIYEQGIYKVDDSAYVGMNISELMLVYPFVDDYDYVYEYDDESGHRTVVFDRDELGNIITILMK